MDKWPIISDMNSDCHGVGWCGKNKTENNYVLFAYGARRFDSLGACLIEAA
jgi:hypothetical protein